jgi:methionine synthase II (cobalamin-independent)
MKGITGLATDIGSLPYKDADEAVDLIFRSCPQIPFWPQLPKKDLREGMVIQFMENLPCIQLDALVYTRGEKKLEECYKNIINNNKDYFKITPDYAVGLYAFKDRLKREIGLLKNIKFIKCQITGPFTFGASIKDEEGVAYLHDPVFMQAFIKGLIMKACWQVDFFKEFNKKIIMFIDEPYLGCFGSAYTPINREDVVKGLKELTQGIKTENVLTGVHCCGNTDWSMFTDIDTIDIINFDAFSFLDKFVLYADNLKYFFERGGIICWGIVPTQEFSGSETPDSLMSKMKDGIDILVRKGLDYDLITENLLLSPSCGMGSLDPQKSEKILRLLSETSQIAQKNL